jgi:hypothetical protein
VLYARAQPVCIPNIFRNLMLPSSLHLRVLQQQEVLVTLIS